MINTTFAKLHNAGACIDRYRFLAEALGGVRHYGKDTPIPLDKLLEINGLDDALWALRAVIEPADREIRLLACDFAEHILHFYEDKYPDDKRPRLAIETSRRFAEGKATQTELDAARAAAWAARDAAWAAAWAARDAAGDAWDAARDAAWAARDAAGDAWDAERKWQTEKLLEMLKGEVKQ
jgi:hypothetical protein